ncbi:HNH endonuclease [Basfia succiniciproducens]|uniref:HNH endonuclease n=1 Tax=Basfia succiniciproducens TaxID=653940 RepID=UPI003FCC5671
MIDQTVNGFIFPNVIVDEHLRDLSDDELKALFVFYRFNTAPTSEDLSFHGVDNQTLDLALEKVGIMTESRAKALIKEMANEYSEAISTLWRWGDGEGGGLLDIIAQELELSTSRVNAKARENLYKKKRISHSLRMQVFERDKYRCVTCGTHLNLTCDHIFPEALGGETALSNLQTMCKSCNSKKGTKVEQDEI